jgi:ribosome maturation factor RimP
VRVRTTDAIEGRRNFTGTIAEADDDSVLVAAEGTPVRIPITGIKRSNLIGDVSL